MAGTENKPTAWLRDPLETEEDVADMEDMSVAALALGHPVGTTQDGEEFERLRMQARAKRLGQPAK